VCSIIAAIGDPCAVWCAADWRSGGRASPSRRTSLQPSSAPPRCSARSRWPLQPALPAWRHPRTCSSCRARCRPSSSCALRQPRALAPGQPRTLPRRLPLLRTPPWLDDHSEWKRNDHCFRRPPPRPGWSGFRWSGGLLRAAACGRGRAGGAGGGAWGAAGV
jgi:hypothetical protein